MCQDIPGFHEVIFWRFILAEPRKTFLEIGMSCLSSIVDIQGLQHLAHGVTADCWILRRTSLGAQQGVSFATNLKQALRDSTTIPPEWPEQIIKRNKFAMGSNLQATKSRSTERDMDVCGCMRIISKPLENNSKKLLTSNKGIATRSKDATRGSWPYY